MTQKKHIITIAGKPGSGKSTTAGMLADELDFEKYSTGNFFRELSDQKGLDILAGNHHAENDRSIDDAVDDRQKQLGINNDNFIIDGRLSWYFIPTSFKVYLDLDTNVAAQRILSEASSDRAEKEIVHEDPSEYADALNKRLASENKRYKDLYGVDPGVASNYDLVIDTANSSPAEVTQLVLKGFKDWLDS